MRSSPSLSDSLVVISDRLEPLSDYPHPHAIADAPFPDRLHAEPVIGGYLERLPLSMVSTGFAGHAEIWHHHRGSEIHARRDSSSMVRRAFPVSGDHAPFHSDRMIDFVRRHGAPKVLCVWDWASPKRSWKPARTASSSTTRSMHRPCAFRSGVSRHFDLVLTAADWQSAEIRERHPDMPTAVLPIGPEFASPETFFPLDEPKRYDAIYVAAAQPYKRHDLLFDALRRSPRPLRALCVMGYGEDGGGLRELAARMELSVDFVGPPGVPFPEVNRLMNQARVGVVCGVDDGAPAILTEYMHAGLPVVANASLRCGLQYIRPETGVVAPGDALELGIMEALDRTDFTPRQTVLERWTWQHSVQTLQHLMTAAMKHPDQRRPVLAKGSHERPDPLRTVRPRRDAACAGDLLFASALGFRPATAAASDEPAGAHAADLLLRGVHPDRPSCAYLEYHPYPGTEIVSLRPRVPHGWDAERRDQALSELLDLMLRLNGITQPVLWFYSPMMFTFARHVDASAVVYDCMDELANFRFAPPGLKRLEADLMARADLVLTGGASLYAARKAQHDNIHCFPSGVDVEHFAKVRDGCEPEPAQAALPGRSSLLRRYRRARGPGAPRRGGGSKAGLVAGHGGTSRQDRAGRPAEPAQPAFRRASTTARCRSRWRPGTSR